MAFATYCLTLWTAFDMFNPAERARQVASSLSTQTLSVARRTRAFAALNAVLVASTALSGAYVAGNDAGRAFNTFPLMGEEWIPSDILAMSPTWRNFFENTSTVQFQHRVLALTTLTSVAGMYGSALSNGLWAGMPAYSRAALHAVAGMSATQVYICTYGIRDSFQSSLILTSMRRLDWALPRYCCMFQCRWQRCIRRDP